MHDERGLVVLVFGVVPRDGLAADLLGPEVLRAARRVVRDHGVGGVEDVLGRPVVLLEHDDRRVRELLLEPHQVPEVRPAELVDRVVRDDAFGDEVVRVLDVEVVDRRSSSSTGSHVGDDVEAPVLVDHHHARAAPTTPA